jgi:hypothetical protein
MKFFEEIALLGVYFGNQQHSQIISEKPVLDSKKI